MNKFSLVYVRLYFDLLASSYEAILFMHMVREIVSYLKYLYSIYIKSTKSFVVVSSHRSLEMFTNRKKCNSVLKKK